MFGGEECRSSNTLKRSLLKQLKSLGAHARKGTYKPERCVGKALANELLAAPGFRFTVRTHRHLRNGETNPAWFPDHRGPRGKAVLQAHFGERDWRECKARTGCTRSKSAGRGVPLQSKEQHLALQAARERQKTGEFRAVDDKGNLT